MYNYKTIKGIVYKKLICYFKFKNYKVKIVFK